METAQSYAWTVSTAKADTALMASSTGGVWQGYAPLATLMPYVLIVAQTPGQDVLTMNAYRVFTNILLQIKAVGPASSFDALVTIADRIDALFKRVKNVALSPGYMLSSFREEALSYDELVGSRQISHLGGLYRIQLQGS